jgi:hypothetical protein
MSADSKKDCPGDFHFSSYLAGTVSEQERAQLEGHFADCPQCCQQLGELYQMYVASDSASDVQLPNAWQRIEAKLGRLRQECTDPGGTVDKAPSRIEPQGTFAVDAVADNVIRLHYRAVRRNVGSMGHALAAASKDAPSAVLTYVSPDQSVLCKLARDEQTDRTTVFLITEDIAALEGALLQVFGPHHECMAEGFPDKNGVLSLDRLRLQEPEATTVEVKAPDATFSLQPRTWRRNLIGTGAVEIHSGEGYSLRIELIERDKGREYRLDLSDLCIGRQECVLRAYKIEEEHVSEITVGAEGVAWLRGVDPEMRRTTIRAYLVKP